MENECLTPEKLIDALIAFPIICGGLFLVGVVIKLIVDIKSNRNLSKPISNE